jgi:hypothetical protein
MNEFQGVVLATDNLVNLQGPVSINSSIDACNRNGIGRGVLDRRFELIDKLD